MLEDWSKSCDWPDPPQPEWQLELLVCDWLAVWSVDAVLDADDVAELLLLCEAELEPPDTLPPATVTGTLAFTPF